MKVESQMPHRWPAQTLTAKSQTACLWMPPSHFSTLSIFTNFPFGLYLPLFPWPLLVPRGNQSPRGSSVLGLWLTSTALGRWPTFEGNAGFSVIASIGWVGSLSAGLCHLMTVSIPSLPGFLLVNILRTLLEPRRCRRPGEGTKKKKKQEKERGREDLPLPAKKEKNNKKNIPGKKFSETEGKKVALRCLPTEQFWLQQDVCCFKIFLTLSDLLSLPCASPLPPMPFLPVWRF